MEKEMSDDRFHEHLEPLLVFVIDFDHSMSMYQLSTINKSIVRSSFDQSIHEKLLVIYKKLASNDETIDILEHVILIEYNALYLNIKQKS